MKKVFPLILLFISFFVFKTNVYADCITGYYCGYVNFNIYDNSTNNFQLYEKDSMMYQQEDKEKMIGVPTIIINNKYTYTATYPKKDGYKFDGWYYDKELTQKLPELFSKIDMELLKSNGYNLYGKWIEGIDDNQNKYEFGKNVYKIRFEIYYTGVNPNNEKSFKYYDNYYQVYEEALLVFEDDDIYLSSGRNNKYYTLPQVENMEDASFKGWYLDSKLEKEATIGLNELKDYSESSVITLYGKWYSNDPEKENISFPDDEKIIDNETPEVIASNDDIATGVIEEDSSNTLIYCAAGIGLLLITGIAFAIVIIKKGKNKKLIISNIEE